MADNQLDKKQQSDKKLAEDKKAYDLQHPLYSGKDYYESAWTGEKVNKNDLANFYERQENGKASHSPKSQEDENKDANAAPDTTAPDASTVDTSATSVSAQQTGPTQSDRASAKNQLEIAKTDAGNAMLYNSRLFSGYDFADRASENLTKLQKQQAARQSEIDRFNAQADLIDAFISLVGGLGTAATSSTALNIMDMVSNWNDKENGSIWENLEGNWNTLDNELLSQKNAQDNNRNELAARGEKDLADMESSTAANLNNINPSLYTKPGTGDADLGSSGYYDKHKAQEREMGLTGYLMPATAVDAARSQTPRNRLSSEGGNYWSRVMNYKNRR